MEEKYKTCPICNKKFTKDDLEKKSIKQNYTTSDRDFNRRIYCSSKCQIKGCSLRAKECKQNNIKKCQACGYNEYPILQIHHIIEKHNGGTNDFDNLIVLCPNCHKKAHKKFITKGELYNFCTKEEVK